MGDTAGSGGKVRRNMPMDMTTAILAVTAAAGLLCGAALLTIITRLNQAAARERGE